MAKEAKKDTTPKVPANPEETKKKRAEAIRAALNSVIEKNLAGFKKPFVCIGTEEGDFISINGRPGKLAYVVQDAKGDKFKVGRTQLNELGIKPPARKAKEPKAEVAGQPAAPTKKVPAKPKSPLPE